MGGIGRTILIDSEVSIAMICNDNCLVACLQYSLDYLTNTCIHSSNSLFNSLIDSCVTYHITIGKIHNNKIIGILLYIFHQLVLHFKSTHFGLKIISGHLGRRHQDSVLTLKRLFTTSIEEESDMGIFFCLCRMQLLQAL